MPKPSAVGGMPKPQRGGWHAQAPRRGHGVPRPDGTAKEQSISGGTAKEQSIPGGTVKERSVKDRALAVVFRNPYTFPYGHRNATQPWIIRPGGMPKPQGAGMVCHGG